MSQKNTHKVFNGKGFSLIEVLLGISVFMIGMLGVTALNISSLKSNTFSGNLSEAVFIAGGKIEELMAIDYEDAMLDGHADGTGQDTNNNGLDDDNPDDPYTGTPHDTNPNFGLDNNTQATADGFEGPLGKNNIFMVYWNVADGEPIPGNTKTVNVIVEWEVKGFKRSINITFVRMDFDET